MNTALATRSTDEVLIKPANIEEDILSLISEMRRSNLTAKQVEYIEHQRKKAFCSFRKIVRRKFGLSDEQILDLNDQKLEALFVMLVKRAQKSLWYQYPLHIFPITLTIISIINYGWDPNVHLSRAINSLRRVGDHSITGLDLRKNIENFRINCANELTERSCQEKDIIQRRKP